MSHQNTGATHSKIKPRYLTKSRFKMATECPTKDKELGVVLKQL